jgi:hypothetical protein
MTVWVLRREREERDTLSTPPFRHPEGGSPKGLMEQEEGLEILRPLRGLRRTI